MREKERESRRANYYRLRRIGFFFSYNNHKESILHNDASKQQSKERKRWREKVSLETFEGKVQGDDKS